MMLRLSTDHHHTWLFKLLSQRALSLQVVREVVLRTMRAGGECSGSREKCWRERIREEGEEVGEGEVEGEDGVGVTNDFRPVAVGYCGGSGVVSWGGRCRTVVAIAWPIVLVFNILAALQCQCVSG